MSQARTDERTGHPKPLAVSADSVRVKVRIVPRARANRINGLHVEANGDASLKVAVTAPPEGGKANAALIALLAREWRLPKSAFTISAGSTSRSKTLHIVGGNPADVMARLDAWLRERNLSFEG